MHMYKSLGFLRLLFPSFGVGCVYIAIPFISLLSPRVRTLYLATIHSQDALVSFFVWWESDKFV